jgi:hypothetical protein
MSRSVLMLEFNELSPVLMDRFIAEGHLPNFARLRDRSATYITEAGESGDRLNPWVQWVTVHTGATAEEHGIEKLGEASKLTLPTIADAVTAAGGSVWLCGPMNVHPVAPVRGALLPDPWSVDAEPQPSELRPFHRFVSANVQEHTNHRSPLSKREATAFVTFVARHGLSLGTSSATVAQLIGERTRRAPRWQRAELLDRFQWDVFAHYHRRICPRFATFFSNSTAHLQHLYWGELDHGSAGTAVLHGYRKMDDLVGKASDLAGDDSNVVLCTALSQTANVEDAGYEGFYRPRELATFAGAIGLQRVIAVAPMMAEQFHLYFDSDAPARAGSDILELARSGDEPVFDVRRNGSDVVVGCRFLTKQRDGTPVTVAGRQLTLDQLFYWSDAPREGTHHADGMLWIGNGGASRNTQVRLTAVAPTILDLLEVAAPASMPGAPLIGNVT